MNTLKPISVYTICNFGGIEILNIEYGIDDRIIYRYNFGQPEIKHHKAKIYYSVNGLPYFKTKYGRIYLDDCICI